MDEARYREAEHRLWESVSATPSEQRLRLDRTGVTVRVQEVGEGLPIVFVHGLSNGALSWATLAARLDGFRCVLLDRPGCGLSEPLAATLDDPGALAAYGDALVVDVLDALAIDHAHIVGTSFGGYFALRAAAAHPGRVDRVVEFGWTVGSPTKTLPLVLRLGSMPAVGRLMNMMPINERAVRAMLGSIGLRQALANGRFSQAMVDAYVSLLRDTDTMRNELRQGPHAFQWRGIDKSTLLDAGLLSTIGTPTYFLWGEEDPMGDAAIARAFVSQIPGAELEMMPAAGHAVWVDDVEHAAAVTRQFLEGEEAIRAPVGGRAWTSD
jgi:pimeloyl-ACP methyl ester carboxylesterase